MTIGTIAHPFLGAGLALGSAVCWSFALIFLKKASQTVPAVLINLYKSLLAFILTVPLIFLTHSSLWVPTHPTDLGLMLLSGLVGIGLADALVLKSLAMIGASRIAILDCLYSPFVIGLSILFLGEFLGLRQFVGAIAILMAVFLISYQKSSSTIGKNQLLLGCAAGALGLFAMAAGIVLVKPLLSVYPLFWVVGVRLFSGIFGAILMVLLFENRSTWAAALKKENIVSCLPGCFLGGGLAMWMWLGGFKFTSATVAAVLNQTSTVFTVILAGAMLHEPLNRKTWIATALAMIGVLIML